MIRHDFAGGFDIGVKIRLRIPKRRASTLEEIRPDRKANPAQKVNHVALAGICKLKSKILCTNIPQQETVAPHWIHLCSYLSSEPRFLKTTGIDSMRAMTISASPINPVSVNASK